MVHERHSMLSVQSVTYMPGYIVKYPQHPDLFQRQKIHHIIHAVLAVDRKTPRTYKQNEWLLGSDYGESRYGDPPEPDRFRYQHPTIHPSIPSWVTDKYIDRYYEIGEGRDIDVVVVNTHTYK